MVTDREELIEQRNQLLDNIMNQTCYNETSLEPWISSPTTSYSSSCSTRVSLSGLIAVCGDIKDTSWIKLSFHQHFSQSSCSPLKVTLSNAVAKFSSKLFQHNSTHAQFTINMTSISGDFCVIMSPHNVPGCSDNPPQLHPPWSSICHPQLLSQPLHFPPQHQCLTEEHSLENNLKFQVKIYSVTSYSYLTLF